MRIAKSKYELNNTENESNVTYFDIRVIQVHLNCFIMY